MRAVIVALVLSTIFAGVVRSQTPTNDCAAQIGSNPQAYNHALNTVCNGATNCATDQVIPANGAIDANKGPTFENCNTATCCVDPCVARETGACITDDNLCMVLPSAGSTTLCMQREKVCAAATMNASACDRYEFCAFESGRCRYNAGKIVSAPPGESVADKCAALHPVVIAMLSLMFITFIGAVVLVAVVVYNNQRKFDEDEKHREIAQAAAAEAKASRQRRNQL